MKWKRALAPLWRRAPGPLRELALRLMVPRFRLSAAAVCLDPDGRMLLLKHRLRTGERWGLPGGLIERDEEISDGLVRELREETGLEATVVDILCASSQAGAVSVTYLLRVGRAEPTLQRSEIEGYRWVVLDDEEPHLSPGAREAVRVARARLRGTLPGVEGG